MRLCLLEERTRRLFVVTAGRGVSAACSDSDATGVSKRHEEGALAGVHKVPLEGQLRVASK